MKEWDMNDVVLSTWFCHSPILGQPCGRCNPCKDALAEGLAWRVPIIGRLLGVLRMIITGFRIIIRQTLRFLHIKNAKLFKRGWNELEDV
jgi:hypothetical protein